MRDSESQLPSAKHDQRARDDWDVLAHHYDSRHEDAGNDWHRNLVLPTTLNLLGDIQGKRGIDLCCGSGVLARQLVELGAQVTGADRSETFLSLAEQYDGSADVEWLCFALADIAEHVEPSSFDFATCTMALMDIPASEDLFFAEVTKSALEETPTRHTDFFIPPTLEDEIPVLLGLRFRPCQLLREA